jgi:hypothetical protein
MMTPNPTARGTVQLSIGAAIAALSATVVRQFANRF